MFPKDACYIYQVTEALVLKVSSLEDTNLSDAETHALYTILVEISLVVPFYCPPTWLFIFADTGQKPWIIYLEEKGLCTGAMCKISIHV